LKPEDFGLTRYVHIAHRLTGWNAIKSRAEQLGLELTDDEIKNITVEIKSLADLHPLTLDEVDSLLYAIRNKIENVTPVEATV
jgi:homocitrate synthase